MGRRIIPGGYANGLSGSEFWAWLEGRFDEDPEFKNRYLTLSALYRQAIISDYQDKGIHLDSLPETG